MSKYPNCQCGSPRFEYFRKRYRNGSLHLIRRCPECQKVAQNPMRQDEYDRSWVDGLPILTGAVLKPMALSRTQVIHERLQKHIANRTQQ